jgi:hypothetical protein
MRVDDAELRLDGNAVAGLFAEIFAVEMTTAEGVCGWCGAIEPLGALSVYLHAPGVVVRCPHCDGLLIRIVRQHAHYRLDLRGLRSLELSAPPA